MSVDALKIVHVCAPAVFGGLERVVQGISRGLVRRGHHVAVVAVLEPGASCDLFVEPLLDVGVDTHVVSVPRRAYFKEVKVVGDLLDTLRPQVLHTHGHRPDLLHPGHARRRGIAVVTTLHGFGNAGGDSSFSERLQTRTLERFDQVVAVSPSIASSLVDFGVSPWRVHLIPNAWEPPVRSHPRAEARRMLNVSGDTPVIGWVGRLCEVKGPDVFIDALGELRRRSRRDWVACVVGDGPDRPALEARVRAARLEACVRFVGVVPEASSILSAFDLLVSSSRSEGTPMVLLEAMGARVPVVASYVGGIPTLLDGDGRHSLGWLVPPQDPSALASAIADALEDAKGRSARAEMARMRVESEYGVDLWVRRHEELYRLAIGG